MYLRDCLPFPQKDMTILGDSSNHSEADDKEEIWKRSNQIFHEILCSQASGIGARVQRTMKRARGHEDVVVHEVPQCPQ
jgi:hypothetical protein